MVSLTTISDAVRPPVSVLEGFGLGSVVSALSETVRPFSLLSAQAAKPALAGIGLVERYAAMGNYSVAAGVVGKSAAVSAAARPPVSVLEGFGLGSVVSALSETVRPFSLLSGQAGKPGMAAIAGLAERYAAISAEPPTARLRLSARDLPVTDVVTAGGERSREPLATVMPESPVAREVTVRQALRYLVPLRRPSRRESAALKSLFGTALVASLGWMDFIEFLIGEDQPSAVLELGVWLGLVSAVLWTRWGRRPEDS